MEICNQYLNSNKSSTVVIPIIRQIVGCTLKSDRLGRNKYVTVAWESITDYYAPYRIGGSINNYPCNLTTQLSPANKQYVTKWPIQTPHSGARVPTLW
jgi:hypothetical protein